MEVFIQLVFCFWGTHSSQSLPSITLMEGVLTHLLSTFSPFLTKVNQLAPAFSMAFSPFHQDVLFSDAHFPKDPFVLPHATPTVSPDSLSLTLSYRPFKTLFLKTHIYIKMDPMPFDKMREYTLFSYIEESTSLTSFHYTCETSRVV